MQNRRPRLKSRSLHRLSGVKGKLVNFSSSPGNGLALLSLTVGRTLSVPLTEFRPILKELGESLIEELHQIIRPSQMK